MVRAGVQVRAVVRVVSPLERINHSNNRRAPLESVSLCRETLESVSSCTRFSGFLTISSFGFNRLSSKLVSMFLGIVPMFVPKDFVLDCFVAQICANYTARTHILAQICATKQSRTKSFSTNIGTIPKNMPTNFELERLKPKLDIFKIPENRVHELTDSLSRRRARV